MLIICKQLKIILYLVGSFYDMSNHELSYIKVSGQGVLGVQCLKQWTVESL